MSADPLTAIRVSCDYRGERRDFLFKESVIVIGRSGGDEVNLKLDFDHRISRRHARIWLDGEHFWIADSDSAGGTRVNGTHIKGNRVLNHVDRVQVGETILQVELAGLTEAHIPAPPGSSLGLDEASLDSALDSDATRIQRREEQEQREVEISARRDSRIRSAIQLPGADKDLRERLQLLYDLPLQLVDAQSAQGLYDMILERVVELIPGAERGALLILDRLSNKLALRSSIPENSPPISRTLIKRAASEAGGFIWSREEEMDPSVSMARLGIETGMYTPLMWKDEVLGVLCVDNAGHSKAFGSEDLEFLMAVANYAAAAVRNQMLQADLEHFVEIQHRLLTNFSPKLREKLLDKARAGRLKPGGEKSEVTLLMSDLRGFAKTTADMSTESLVDMLNEYFSALVTALFEHGGTVDKFIGDAILAVFGSPEPDGQQRFNAINAATAMQAALEQVNIDRKSRGDRTCELGIGLHHGEVLHGFIGAAERLEFTVIGDAVNKVSRICDGARGGEVLVSESVRSPVAHQFDFEAQDIQTKHEGQLSVWKVSKKALAETPPQQ
jgi:adenylate cyclase